MLLIFDCDGVVIDSMLLHTEVESEAYQNIGIKISSQDLVRRFSGISQSEVDLILGKETGVSIPPDFAKSLEAQKKRVFAERLQPMMHLREILEDDLWDIPRCIASGRDLDGLKHDLTIVNLYDLFAPHLFSSEMVARGKPYPDLFFHAANQMKTQCNNCFVIEDGVSGVKAGVAAGMTVFGFTGGSHCDEEHAGQLKAAGASRIFSNMSDLPKLIGSE